MRVLEEYIIVIQISFILLHKCNIKKMFTLLGRQYTVGLFSKLISDGEGYENKLKIVFNYLRKVKQIPPMTRGYIKKAFHVSCMFLKIISVFLFKIISVFISKIIKAVSFEKKIYTVSF